MKSTQHILSIPFFIFQPVLMIYFTRCFASLFFFALEHFCFLKYLQKNFLAEVFDSLFPFSYLIANWKTLEVFAMKIGFDWNFPSPHWSWQAVTLLLLSTEKFLITNKLESYSQKHFYNKHEFVHVFKRELLNAVFAEWMIAIFHAREHDTGK